MEVTSLLSFDESLEVDEDEMSSANARQISTVNGSASCFCGTGTLQLRGGSISM